LLAFEVSNVGQSSTCNEQCVHETLDHKKNIQREIGREVRSDELGHAVRSIRRVQLYIENILDGINYVKHNLEYGYSLMNLIELPRRKRHQ